MSKHKKDPFAVIPAVVEVVKDAIGRCNIYRSDNNLHELRFISLEIEDRVERRPVRDDIVQERVVRSWRLSMGCWFIPSVFQIVVEEDGPEEAQVALCAWVHRLYGEAAPEALGAGEAE